MLSRQRRRRSRCGPESARDLRTRELDLLGARAWPGLDEFRIDGWRLRFAGGVTKRASLVLPLGPEDATTLDRADLLARLDAVEREYAARGLPSRFQLTASSWPRDLPAQLSLRGYVESDPTLVMTARLDAGERAGSSWEIEHRRTPSPAWLSVWWAVDGRRGAAEAEIVRRILSRIEPETTFVECRDEAGLVGGLGVLDGGAERDPSLGGAARRRACAPGRRRATRRRWVSTVGSGSR